MSPSHRNIERVYISHTNILIDSVSECVWGLLSRPLANQIFGLQFMALYSKLSLAQSKSNEEFFCDLNWGYLFIRELASLDKEVDNS